MYTQNVAPSQHAGHTNEQNTWDKDAETRSNTSDVSVDSLQTEGMVPETQFEEQLELDTNGDENVFSIYSGDSTHQPVNLRSEVEEIVTDNIMKEACSLKTKNKVHDERAARTGKKFQQGVDIQKELSEELRLERKAVISHRGKLASNLEKLNCAKEKLDSEVRLCKAAGLTERIVVVDLVNTKETKRN